MERMRIAAIFADQESLGGREVTVCGWARTIRDMKTFGFIELNDGSCFRNLQVVMSAGELSNYKEIAAQNVGASLIVRGTVVLTPDAKQPLEVKAHSIEVEGKSAHASAPHEGVDAVMVASAILQSIQQLVSRMNDPLNPLVITVGKVTAGNRWNVLAGHATLEGTVRTFLTGTQVEDALRKVAECTAAAFGAKATLSYQYMTEPVINSDEQLNRIAQTAVTKLYGKESLITPAPLMGSEDFSWFGKDGIPYIYGFVASHNKDWDHMYGNHHEKYDVDETILHRGAAVAAQFAADYLAETAQQ